MLSSWPTFKEEWNFKAEEEEISLIKEAVRNIRNLRSEMNVPPSRKAKVFVVTEDEKVARTFENGKVFFAVLGYASEVVLQKDMAGIDSDAVSVVIPNATVYIPFAELVDIEKEIERLNKEKAKLESEVERVNKKLSNEGFVAKAPSHLLEEEKAKKEKYETMLAGVVERLSALSK